MLKLHQKIYPGTISTMKLMIVLLECSIHMDFTLPSNSQVNQIQNTIWSSKINLKSRSFYNNSEWSPTKTSTANISGDDFRNGSIDYDHYSDHVSYYGSDFWHGIAIRQNGIACVVCNQRETGKLIYCIYRWAQLVGIDRVSHFVETLGITSRGSLWSSPRSLLRTTRLGAARRIWQLPKTLELGFYYILPCS